MDNNRGFWRGKLKYDIRSFKRGEWINGDFTRLGNNNVAIIPHIYGYGEVEVIPETLGECAGFSEKGDTLIFEGDILKADGYTSGGIGIVRYGEYCATIGGETWHRGFYVEWLGKEAGILRNDLGYWAKYAAVIGNIYDNSELISEQNNEW